MSRFQPALIALTLALAAGAAQAQSPVGQPPALPYRYSAPVVSPYLNLLNRGNPAINYYGIVRPQVQANQQIQMLQYGLARTTAEEEAANATTAAPGQPPETGHVTGFMTYQKYFNTFAPRGR
jgi:hypothetical protein